MKKNLSIGLLVICFGFSSVDSARPEQSIEVPPIIVQPYAVSQPHDPNDLREISQQMIGQDLINGDQQMANRELSTTPGYADLVRKEAALEEVNETMIKYRDFLMSREQSRQAQKGPEESRYGELIKLTEDVDGTRPHGPSDALEQKYKMLSDLKNELMALNAKFKGSKANQETVKEAPTPASGYEEILAEKNGEIGRLKDDMALLKSELEEKLAQNVKGPQGEAGRVRIQQLAADLKAKDEAIRQLNQVLAVYKSKAEYEQLTSAVNETPPLSKVEKEVQDIKDNVAQRSKDYDRYEKAIVSLKGQVKDKEEQIGNLKNELQSQRENMAKMGWYNRGLALDQLGRLSLAKELIALQRQQADLLGEKNELMKLQDAIFERHALAIEKKIKDLLAAPRPAKSNLQAQVQELKNALSQREQQVALLKAELKNKISEGQNMADLNARAQGKETEIIGLKKELSDWQRLATDRDRELQTKDLSLAMIERKMKANKISEYQRQINALQATTVKQAQEMTTLRADLALARQQLAGSPNVDEVSFLREGLKKASLDLKEKNKMLAASQAQAAEYERKFKEQSREFKSLKQQLEEAGIQINRQNEDLKYKSMEVIRLKERSAVAQGKLKDRIKALSTKLASINKGAYNSAKSTKVAAPLKAPAESKSANKIYVRMQPDKAYQNKLESLQAQLKSDDVEIKELKQSLKQMKSAYKSDIAAEKLKQALDKIDEQGRIINVLVQKLQESGQAVDLTKYTHPE